MQELLDRLTRTVTQQQAATVERKLRAMVAAGQVGPGWRLMHSNPDDLATPVLQVLAPGEPLPPLDGRAVVWNVELPC